MYMIYVYISATALPAQGSAKLLQELPLESLSPVDEVIRGPGGGVRCVSRSPFFSLIFWCFLMELLLATLVGPGLPNGAPWCQKGAKKQPNGLQNGGLNGVKSGIGEKWKIATPPMQNCCF